MDRLYLFLSLLFFFRMANPFFCVKAAKNYFFSKKVSFFTIILFLCTRITRKIEKPNFMIHTCVLYDVSSRAGLIKNFVCQLSPKGEGWLFCCFL